MSSSRAPGEACSKPVVEALKEMGVSFEAEGGMVRIHVGGGAYIEISASHGGCNVTLAASLPALPEEVYEALEAMAKGLSLILSLGSPRYDLDASIPDYPMLYATISGVDPSILLAKLKERFGGELRD